MGLTLNVLPQGVFYNVEKILLGKQMKKVQFGNPVRQHSIFS